MLDRGNAVDFCVTCTDPLVFHNTHEVWWNKHPADVVSCIASSRLAWCDQPLMEEYSMAQHLFGLTNMDLSEIALNSVKMSSFDDEVKAQWLGQVWAGMGC